MKRAFFVLLIAGGILTSAFAALVLVGRARPPELNESERLLLDRWARLRSCEAEMKLIAQEAEATSELLSLLEEQLDDCSAILKGDPGNETAGGTLERLSREIPETRDRLKRLRLQADAQKRLRDALVEYLMLASAALSLPPDVTDGMLKGSLREEDIIRAMLEAREKRED